MGGVTVNQEVVTYDGLPASAGGAHSLRTKNPRAAYESVQTFLDAVVLTIGAPETSFQLWAGGQAAGRWWFGGGAGTDRR